MGGLLGPAPPATEADRTPRASRAIARCSRDLAAPSEMPSAVAASGSGTPRLVVHDDQRPVLRRQLRQGVIERLVVGEALDRIAGLRHEGRCDVDLDGPAATASCLVDRRVDEQSVQPGVEPVRVAQAREVAPGADAAPPGPRRARAPGHGGSVGPPRPVRVAAARTSDGEGFAIASACLVDERPLVHGVPSNGASFVNALRP